MDPKAPLNAERPIEISPQAHAAMAELVKRFSDPRVASQARFRCRVEGPDELDVWFESILDEQFGYDPKVNTKCGSETPLRHWLFLECPTNGIKPPFSQGGVPNLLIELSENKSLRVSHQCAPKTPIADLEKNIQRAVTPDKLTEVILNSDGEVCHYCCRGYIGDGSDVRPCPECGGSGLIHCCEGERPDECLEHSRETAPEPPPAVHAVDKVDRGTVPRRASS